MPISAFLQLLVSEVACGEECALLALLAYFCRSLPVLPQLKNFFQKSKCAHHPRTRCHFCAKFDVLSQSWDIVWKKNSHPPRHPAYSPPVNLRTEEKTSSIIRHEFLQNNSFALAKVIWQRPHQITSGNWNWDSRLIGLQCFWLPLQEGSRYLDLFSAVFTAKPRDITDWRHLGSSIALVCISFIECVWA